MTSLLAQALTTETALSQLVPFVALLTAGVLLWFTFIKKDKRALELLTTQNLLVPVFMFIALALAPASVMALFGFAESTVMTVVQILIAILFPMIIVGGFAFLLKRAGVL